MKMIGIPNGNKMLIKESLDGLVYHLIGMAFCLSSTGSVGRPYRKKSLEEGSRFCLRLNRLGLCCSSKYGQTGAYVVDLS
jgi:hypothetical protein